MPTQSFSTQKLRDMLALLSPVVDETATAPIKSCVVFNGEHAYADDGFSRIEIDFPTEVHFAAPLRPVLGLLGTVTSEAVELAYEKKKGAEAGTLYIRDSKRKKDRIEVPCLEDDRLLNETKLDAKDDRAYVNESLAKALADMKKNADMESERPGVNLEFSKDGVRLGTYSDSLFWLMNVNAYPTPGRNRFSRAYNAVLMPWVASGLATVFKASEKNIATLTFHDDYLHFSIAAGDKMPAIRVICNPPAKQKTEAEPFETTYEQIVKAFKPGKFFPIPEHLPNAVTRANVLMSSSDLSKDFELEVLDGGFRLSKKTAFGEVEVAFAADHGCQKYSGLLRHDKLEVILPYVDEMAFSKDGAVFLRGEGNRAFISVPRQKG